MNRQAIRDAIVSRDGNGCYYCGRKLQHKTKAKRLPTNYMQIEHKLAQAAGGSDDLENLVGSCKSCNRRKGSKEYKEYLQWEFQQVKLQYETLKQRIGDVERCSQDGR